MKLKRKLSANNPANWANNPKKTKMIRDNIKHNAIKTFLCYCKQYHITNSFWREQSFQFLNSSRVWTETHFQCQVENVDTSILVSELLLSTKALNWWKQCIFDCCKSVLNVFFSVKDFSISFGGYVQFKQVDKIVFLPRYHWTRATFLKTYFSPGLLSYLDENKLKIHRKRWKTIQKGKK